jgi:4-carboxymuconolactone decarboxylase
MPRIFTATASRSSASLERCFSVQHCQQVSVSRQPIVRALAACTFALALCAGSASYAQDRMPPITPETYNEVQKKAAEEYRAARKVPVAGPFSVLIRSPELMNAYRTFGDYLRFKASIGIKLSELIILITAREWTQDYEWFVHAPIALKQGIGQDIIDAIAEGRRPSGMSEDMEICYDLTIELHRNKRVSDATYARAVKLFGEQGVIDIVAVSGYYTSLAMVLNTTRMPIPAGGKRLLRFPE